MPGALPDTARMPGQIGREGRGSGTSAQKPPKHEEWEKVEGRVIQACSPDAREGGDAIAWTGMQGGMKCG